MAEETRKTLTKIPTDIPRQLFLQGSTEEYCYQLKKKRLERRQAKYGEGAQILEMPIAPPQSDPVNTHKTQARFAPPAAAGTFSSPMTRAASIVALLVVGIACYSTYFGA